MQDLEIQLPTPSVETVQNVKSSPKKYALPKRILRSHTKIRHVLKFTKEEDDFLREGITKHGFGQRTAIVRDSRRKNSGLPKEKGWNENGPS